jgi:hypothetical protein
MICIKQAEFAHSLVKMQVIKEYVPSTMVVL